MEDFQPQPVKEPVLDTQTRQQITPPAKASRFSGLKDFYSANKYYFWAILIGLVAIIVLAAFAFRKGPAAAPKEAKLALTIDAPDTVGSGSEIIYKIKAENQDSVDFNGLTLELAYPQGVTFESSSVKSENLSGTSFPIPDIKPSQNAVVIIKASVQGNINDERTVTAKLHYHYANSNVELVKQTDFTSRIIESGVTLEINGAATASNAQVLQYDIRYKNNSDHDITNSSRVQIEYPQGFTYASGTPAPTLGNNIWTIEKLNKGDEGHITFQGSFQSATPGQAQSFTVHYLVMGDGGSYFTQATSTFTTSISSVPLVVTQQLSDQFRNNEARPGDVLDYTLKYQNNDTVAQHGVNVVATLDSKALDLSTIRAEGAQINNNSIIWNASSSPSLDVLSPNESGTLHFTVKIKNPPVRDTSTNVDVKSSVKIKSDERSDFLPGNGLTVKIASLADVTGAVQYVSGALPPQVGKSSTYQITLSLRNLTNDYSNVSLTAVLPVAAGGFDKNSIPVGEANNVAFDPSTGKLTWRVGQLPAHTGDFSPARKLSFKVSIVPASSQAGNAVVLTKNIVVTATDSFLQETGTFKTTDLATDDDPQSSQSGNGRVIP